MQKLGLAVLYDDCGTFWSRKIGESAWTLTPFCPETGSTPLKRLRGDSSSAFRQDAGAAAPGEMARLKGSATGGGFGEVDALTVERTTKLG